MYQPMILTWIFRRHVELILDDVLKMAFVGIGNVCAAFSASLLDYILEHTKLLIVAVYSKYHPESNMNTFGYTMEYFSKKYFAEKNPWNHRLNGIFGNVLIELFQLIITYLCATQLMIR